MMPVSFDGSSQVHAVFHLVSDDSVRSADLNSRHAVLLGLRHILRTAVMSDITTLTIPLLLVHELSEEMTVPWCVRRAELVFKCVKVINKRRRRRRAQRSQSAVDHMAFSFRHFLLFC